MRLHNELYTQVDKKVFIKNFKQRMKDKLFHLSFMMLASNCYAQINGYISLLLEVILSYGTVLIGQKNLSCSFVPSKQLNFMKVYM